MWTRKEKEEYQEAIARDDLREQRLIARQVISKR
jgi:hypothetical protein